MHSSYRNQFCNKLSMYTTERGVLVGRMYGTVHLNCTHIIAHTQFTLHTYIINMMWFVARKKQRSCSAQYSSVSYYSIQSIHLLTYVCVV